MLKKNPYQNLLYILIFGVLFYLAFPTLYYPFGRDQSLFTYMGRVWLLGGAPYRDAVDLVPPAVFILTAISELIFGPHPYGLRIFDLCFVILVICSIIKIGEHFTTRNQGICAAFIFIFLYYGCFDFWNTAQKDGWQSFFLCFAVFYSLQKKPFSSGVLLGISFLFKFTSVLALPMFLLHHFRSDEQTKYKSLRSFLFGGALITGLILGLCLYQSGFTAIKEVWYDFCASGYWHATMNPENDLMIFLRQMTALPGSTILYCLLLICGTLYEGFCLILHRRNKNLIAYLTHERGFILLWFITTIACVYIQGKYYTYHWLMILVPLSLLLVHWTCRFYHHAQNSIGNIALKAVVTTSLVYLLYIPINQTQGYWQRLLMYTRGQISYIEYLKRFSSIYLFNAGDAYMTAKYIQERTNSEDRIQSLAFEPDIYVLSERISPSRFYASHLFLHFRSPIENIWKQQFLVDMARATNLKYVAIHGFYDPLVPFFQNGIALLQLELMKQKRLPQDFQRTRYEAIERFGMFTVFERRLYSENQEQQATKP